jgi:uncharacterized membrane protein YqjE
MEAPAGSVRQLAAVSSDFARRLLTMGGNRLELLTVEIQEERERILRAFLLALGVAAFGVVAGLTLTAAIVVLLWNLSPGAVLLALSGLYGLAGVGLSRVLSRLLREWKTLPATLDQLQKDRACLKKILA